MKNLWAQSPDDLDQPLQDQSWFFGNVVSPTELSDYGTDEPFWVRSNGSKNLAPPIGNRPLASAMTSAPSGKQWSPKRAPIGSAGRPGASDSRAVTIAIGATDEINGPGTQAVTSTGTTGTLKREDAPSFTGSISGLADADAFRIAISPVTIANGATVAIDGASAQSVTFAGTTGTVKLSRFRLANQRIGFLRFAACTDSQGVWHGGKVSGYGER